MASQTDQVRNMIRFIALSLLILSIFISAPITIKGYVSYDFSISTKDSYQSSITQLRKALPTKGKVSNISLLPPTASNSEIFTLIKITNYDEKSITVAFNVTNVYFVAYLAGTESYFLNDAPSVAYTLLFQGTHQNTLPYTGNYDNLQTAAQKRRENIPLGLPALNNAITNLYHYNYRPTAVALLVLIQSTAEAARFTYIEQEVASHSTTDVPPNLAIISLENNWAALSTQIQLAQDRKGQFESPVNLVRPTGQAFQVTNVSSNVVRNNIALLLYYRGNTGNDKGIPPTLRIPIATATDGRDEIMMAMMEARKLIDNGPGNCVTM